MVNLCKSHITALEKVNNALGTWTTTMSGLAINTVLTLNDYKKIRMARIHIDKAIEILSKCNQL